MLEGYLANYTLSSSVEFMGLPKYPRRALHMSGSEARFGGVHFSGPPRFSPLMTFLVFFCPVWVLRPQITLGSPL